MLIKQWIWNRKFSDKPTQRGGIRPYSGDFVLGYFMGCLTEMGYLGMFPKMRYAMVCPKTATLIVKW